MLCVRKRLPAFIRDLLYRIAARSPQLFKQQAGTVTVSTVGMFGMGGGWGLGIGSPYTTGVLVGGISEKPGVVDGQIAIRDYLSLTIEFHHEIIDGVPAARFVNALKGLLENAYGLVDEVKDVKGINLSATTRAAPPAVPPAAGWQREAY
jgi:pyruvate/2-oxoglutarate dehydrogenase complex dihydrolipoamide acyltransferase (E2) component